MTKQSVASITSAASRRVLSGIQPTGVPHLGNYCGALANWVELQKSPGDRLYSVVDLHALTMPWDASSFPDQCRASAASLLALGIDPDRSILFRQSHVPQHAELMWLLSCLTPLGRLQRMTQFKDKAQKQEAGNSSLGLLAYPVLMAADILLYRAQRIPVGEDQQQHLELARDIASGFNSRFETDVFPMPQPVEDEDHGLVRIMSLRDPTKKMSKSDASDMSRIMLSDDADAIRQKIMKAQTDSTSGIWFDRAERPGIANLLSIYSAVTSTPIDALVRMNQDKQTGAFKRDVADAVIDRLAPIGQRIRELQADPAHIDHVLEDGAEKAGAMAVDTLQQVKQRMGL